MFDARHHNSVQAQRWAATAARPTARRLALSPPNEASTADGPPQAESGQAFDAAQGEVSSLGAAAAELRRQAEEAMESGQWLKASQLNVSAAEQASSEGLLAESGWAWAEAARVVQSSDSGMDCSFGYVQALTLLGAADASLEDVSPVMVAWAPSVERDSYPKFLALADRDYPSPAKPHAEDDMEKLMRKLMAPSMIGSPLLRRYLLSWADLKDAQARVMATWGEEADRLKAVELAQEAASRYSMLGRIIDAAHSWWLAGRLAAELKQGDVESNYRLALDGFTTGGTVTKDFLLESAQQYSQFLSSVGKDDEAAEIDALVEKTKE